MNAQFYGKLTNNDINRAINIFAYNDEKKLREHIGDSKCKFLELLLQYKCSRNNNQLKDIIEKNDKYTNYLMYHVYRNQIGYIQLSYKYLFKAFALGNDEARESIIYDIRLNLLERRVIINTLEDFNAANLKKFLDTICTTDTKLYKKLKKKLEIKQYKEKISELENIIIMMEVKHVEEIEKLLKT
jgi:hypothetical protein